MERMNKDKIYIIPSERVKDIFKDCVNRIGGNSNFSKLSGYAKSTIKAWSRGQSAIPFKTMKIIAENLNQNVWAMLEGEKLRGSISKERFIEISQTITTQEALMIGWILSEGHLYICKVSISQNNHLALERLKGIISQVYNFDPSFMSINVDRDGFKLLVNSIAFSQYINWKFSIPIGRKSRIIKISERLMSENREIKMSLLTGLLEGDGSVSFYTRKFKNGIIFKAPRISFNTFSKEMSEQIKILLVELSYHPKDYHDNRGENKVNIFKLSECCKFFFEVYPYLIHPIVILKFSELLSQSIVINSILVDGKEVIKIAYQKFGSYKLLADYISESGYEISASSVKNWCLGFFRPSLSVVTNLCDYLNLNLFDFVPEWLSGILWLHKKITKEKFEKLRSKNKI
jgi:hypothetical protein